MKPLKKLIKWLMLLFTRIHPELGGEIILTKLDSVDEWGDQVIMPAVMFNDSTIKPLDRVMQPLLETIENFFCDNFGGEDC